MISIYSTAYNLSAGMFDYAAAIERWSQFADEVVIATNSVEDWNLLMEETLETDKLKVILTEIPFSEYDFDGKLKNAALQACSEPYCILLDLDEYIPVNQKSQWLRLIETINTLNQKAVLIPVIDLIQDSFHYKSLGYKWYLHQKEGCYRGIVNFAKKEDGKIDITKSDTTELIDKHGNLIPAMYLISPAMDNEDKLQAMKDCGIYVVHTGWLDKETRVKQNDFWYPHWQNRSGRELPPTDLNSIYQNPLPHNLYV